LEHIGADRARCRWQASDDVADKAIKIEPISRLPPRLRVMMGFSHGARCVLRRIGTLADQRQRLSNMGANTTHFHFNFFGFVPIFAS
jgi:hypothetical protein